MYMYNRETVYQHITEKGFNLLFSSMQIKGTIECLVSTPIFFFFFFSLSLFWGRLARNSPPLVPWHKARPYSPATFAGRCGHVIEFPSWEETRSDRSLSILGWKPHPPILSTVFPFPGAFADAMDTPGCHPLKSESKSIEGAQPSNPHQKGTHPNQEYPL